MVLLIAITVLMLIINYSIAQKDFSNPAFLFCCVMLFAEIICLAFSKQFHVVLEKQTVIVISIGLLVFTITAILFNQKKERIMYNELPYISISNYWVVLILLCQVIYIATFIVYIHNISVAYSGTSNGLLSDINTYDYLVKFNDEAFRSLNISPGIIYKLTRLIALSLPYTCLYILINNFCSRKRIGLLLLISIGLLCISIFLSGSRSPLFRVVTMAVILIYFFKFRNRVIHGNQAKFLLKAGIALIVLAFIFINILQLMGRTGSETASHELFKYIGAPLENLDNYLQKSRVIINTKYFGENTFNGFYQLLYDKGFLHFRPTVRYDVLPFQTSVNGLSLGNVYTMFYFFIIDFGYLGIIPCTLIVALYYMYSHHQIICKCVFRKGFSLQLFFFSYLINDLIMAFFSNRFFETVFDPFFYKFLFINIVFVLVVIKGPIRFQKTFLWKKKGKHSFAK